MGFFGKLLISIVLFMSILLMTLGLCFGEFPNGLEVRKSILKTLLPWIFLRENCHVFSILASQWQGTGSIGANWNVLSKTLPPQPRWCAA